MTDPKKDEHIEELLSKLQGIFGKLSHSEEEEAKQSVEVPASVPVPKERESKEPPPQINLYKEPEEAPPAPLTPPTPPTPSAPPTQSSPPQTPVEPPVFAGEGSYVTLVPTEDPERVIVPTAVYFPIGRENEARVLAGKLETMAPKFTKVAFRLRVIVFMPYDPKSEWKDNLLAKAAQAHFQTVFVAVERTIDDAKRKSIVTDLEANNVYFQEVPVTSIEKKAFYTDILLGLVFFFDSRKPPANSEGTTT